MREHGCTCKSVVWEKRYRFVVDSISVFLFVVINVLSVPFKNLVTNSSNCIVEEGFTSLLLGF